MDDDVGGAAALKTMARFMSPARKRQFALVLALTLAAAMAEMLTVGAVLPFLTLLADPAALVDLPVAADLYAALGARSPAGLVVAATALLMIAAVVAGAIRLQLAWSSQRFVYGLGHEISVEVQRRVLGQPYSWHIAHNSREIVASLEKVQVMASAVALQFVQALSAALLSLFLIGLLVSIDARTAGVSAAALVAVYLGVSFLTRRRLARNSRTVASAYSERVGLVQESLGGIRDVIIDDAREISLDAFRRVDGAFSRARATTAFIGSAPRFVIEAAGIVIIAAASLLLSDRPGGFAAALPVVGALALGAQRLLPLVQQIYHGWSSIAGNRRIARDILQLLDLPEPAAETSRAPPLPFEREIRLDSVRFAYPGRPQPALDGISLVIPRGARVAMIGTTGGGKSTLADMVMGLLEPDEGRVTIDDMPLAGPACAAWRRSIAHVPQSIFLADTSIGRNIAFGVESDAIDRDRLAEVARRARLAEFVDSLPEGYDTRVGERGVGLSGGQRQRLGLARALYKGAPVLVLDEATSALDEATEAAVHESLQALSDRDGLTLLMIAHRLPAGVRFDRVVRIEDGRIVEAP